MAKKNSIATTANKKMAKKNSVANPDNKKNLRQRIFSGILLGLLAVALIFLPRWWQLLALLVVVFVSHREWQKLAQRTAHPFTWFIIGFVYILASAIAAIFLLNLHTLWFLQTVVIVIGADTGAYIFGKIWGRHKIAPSISPGKSWEGLVGGLLFANLIMVASAFTFHTALQEKIWGSLCLASLITVFALLGDLFESYFKRRAGAKDSGKIIPGHGGILDRIDGHLMALLLVAILIWLHIF